MRAAVIVAEGKAGSLRVGQVADPEPGPTEVLIAVRAAALNRADLLQRAGRYPKAGSGEAPAIAGMDAAGTVVATGVGVTGVAVGERVMAMCAGAYAELVTVDAGLVLPVPANLDWDDAAALPVALMTECDALANAARLQAGEAVLVTAAGSGVGTIGLQVARVLGAGLVLGTARSPAGADAATAAGADSVLAGTAQGLAASVRDANDGRGVDVVIDHVGAELFAENLDALALGGRLVSVGRLGGREATIDLNALALNRLSLIGVTFRTRDLAQRSAIAAQVRELLLPAVADGRLRPVISATYPLDDALAAQEDMRANRHAGKVILRIGER